MSHRHKNRIVIQPTSRLIRKSPPDPRRGAFSILTETEAGRKDVSALIDDFLQRSRYDRRDEALLTELVYGVLRQQGFLDWQIDQFSKVPKIKTPIRNILRLGLYQLLFLDRIPTYALVNTSVNLAKSAGSEAAGRFVNALLRTLIRSKESLPQPSRDDLGAFIAVSASHPEWMVRRWLARFGEEATLDLCRANNESPPLTLRVNGLKTHREQIVEELLQAGGSAEATSFAPEGVILKGLSIRSLSAYREGRFYIQDEAAQLISHLVDPQPGETLLDLCAAPGGKTTHLAELMGGKATIVATDIDPERLVLVDENIQRLQTPGCRVEPIDIALAADRHYDRILVDAPCSALGILRRIPEGKWRKPPSIIGAYAERQRDLLEKAFQHLKAGGRLIYVTCSTEPEENEDRAAAFSNAHPEMEVEDPRPSLPPPARKFVSAPGYFTTALNSDKMDRFFAVRWIKKIEI